ncbi:hypothetical protein [Planococcus beigongshangi]|uniref:hypothetical protein n=1 Tax=Planococcus beigongshangi TaxID=2782536 RepID=UPI001EEE6D62|nr:hypothetical protein [Planococcus beigongshangi]GKW44548.1 hypothetical protein NCCP2050_02400 [Planococcus sp. NCCP-2050]
MKWTGRLAVLNDQFNAKGVVANAGIVAEATTIAALFAVTGCSIVVNAITCKW